MKKLFAIVLCLAMCFGVLALTASADGVNYYVAGVEALCNGVNWDPAAEANKMTAGVDGNYSITYKAVPAGNYEFKVTNGSWDQCWPGNNYQLALESECDVTIIFNPTTQEITVDASAQGKVTAPEIKYMELLGEGVEGLSWTIGSALQMTKVSDGIYEYTFDQIPAGSFPNIKFAANGNWNDYNFGCIDNTVGAASGVANEAGWNSANIWFEVAAESKVTIRLDLTGFDYETKAGATYTVTIAPVGATENPNEPETPVDPPVQPDPENPKDGDPVSVIFALMAASAVGIVVVSKKKF